ncbi:MAG TPA: hypothetical protein VI316_10695 [Candidatus Dormibacteraeota bacterium]
MIDGLIVVAAAFAASLVESVEALTIVLAVGLTSGWRPALEGVAGALAVLVVIAVAAPVLVSRLPERALLGAVGVLILLVGARWLRKAVLRAAGVIALHDEAAEYAATVAAVSGAPAAQRDWRALSLAFQGTLVEGVEVVFIVAAVGHNGNLLAAASGALAAVVVVAALGVALRHPLQRVPENLLKLIVGVMLCSLGTFWAIEGMGYAWPLDAGAVVVLVAVYAGVAALAITTLRRDALPLLAR